MTWLQRKALRHIVANGDDSNLQGERWRQAKVDLLHMGFIQRRIGDWAFVPTATGCIVAGAASAL